MLYDRLEEAAQAISVATGAPSHDLAVVLGSGLGTYGDAALGATQIPYEEIPGFPIPDAVGHAGAAISLTIGDNRVLLLSGRVHAYEGYSMDQVTFAVRTSILGGCRTVVLTNAAGGCGEGQTAGDLVLVTDHLNLSGLSPLAGPNDPRLGPRFPDMSDVYTAELREVAHTAAREAGVALGEGVYAWFQGPMYETPAEVQMAKRLGADLVGMSTAPEATAARHQGANVVAISLVTNLAAGISPTPLSSEEVISAGAKARNRFSGLLDALLRRL